MVNVRFSIPKELHDKMKCHPQVRWSEIVRKSIVDYTLKMETVKNGVVSSEKLAFILREANMDVS